MNNHYPEITLSEFKGVLFLHFGTEWIQGAMRLGKPNEIVLDYVQQMMIWMLFKEKPSHIVQLGLGSAALTKFCYYHFPDTKVTAIELNPNVINICRKAFHLPEDNHRLTVLQSDAKDYIKSKKGQNDIDILQIDLYDEKAAAPLLDTPAFYATCSEALTSDGLLTINIFGSKSKRSQSIEALRACFDAVVWLPEVDKGNMVLLAFKKAPIVDFKELYKRGRQIRKESRLKAVSWVDGLRSWMEGF